MVDVTDLDLPFTAFTPKVQQAVDEGKNIKSQKKLIILFTFLIIILPSVSSCGWFTYEDIPETRSYYNIFDELDGVEDGTLLMSRQPTIKEEEMNVYIPMNYNG